MEEKNNKSTTWIWIVVIALVVVAGIGAWLYFRGDSTSTSQKASDTKVAAVIPEGWKGFTSSKYGFSLSYPTDYTLAEGPTGTLKLTKDGKEMIDLYVYAANGDEAGMMNSQEALFTDDAKGYMIMDSVVQGKIGGVTSKTVYGKFGKNAGVSQTHEGVTGASAFFTNDDKLFIFDSYDNGDAVAQKVFTDLLASISL